METVKPQIDKLASKEIQDELESSSEASDEENNDTKNDINDASTQADSKADPDDKKKAKKIKKKKLRVLFNISETKYDVIKYVGKKIFGWKLTTDLEAEWDVYWLDQAIQPEFLARMQPFQKVNHFPGMYSLARKNHLGRHLMRMKKAFPNEYKFFPSTWLLPSEFADFRSQFTKKKNRTFIIKPEASCQGRGIFLTRSWESVANGEHYVAQRYIHKPLLIDGLKFDLRIYALIAGCDPLRIFVFDDGLARFATEPYISPTFENLGDMCMHLTNYAINKDNPKFVFNKSATETEIGHKKSIKAVFKMLEELGHDTKQLWDDIHKIIIKTMCSVQPILAHSYKSCQPEDLYNNMCFEILGFDVMLDHKLKPWLIEINHTPSFSTDTPFDRNIKKSVVKDALKIMNVSAEQKLKYKNKKRIELQKRVLTGKKVRVTVEERLQMIQKAQAERDAYETKNLGGYQKVFPVEENSKDYEKYQSYIAEAYKWWEEWTGTAARRSTKKPEATNSNKPPPMVFGNNSVSRAKEIQNIYSQKLKPKTAQKETGGRNSGGAGTPVNGNPNNSNVAKSGSLNTITSNGNSNAQETNESNGTTTNNGIERKRSDKNNVRPETGGNEIPQTNTLTNIDPKNEEVNQEDREFIEHVKAVQHQNNIVDEELMLFEEENSKHTEKSTRDQEKKIILKYSQIDLKDTNYSKEEPQIPSTSSFRIRTHHLSQNVSPPKNNHHKISHTEESDKRQILSPSKRESHEFIEKQRQYQTQSEALNKKFAAYLPQNQNIDDILYTTGGISRYRANDSATNKRAKDMTNAFVEQGRRVQMKLPNGSLGEYRKDQLSIANTTDSGRENYLTKPMSQSNNRSSKRDFMDNGRKNISPSNHMKQQQSGSFVQPKLVEFDFSGYRQDNLNQRMGGFTGIQGVGVNSSGQSNSYSRNGQRSQTSGPGSMQMNGGGVQHSEGQITLQKYYNFFYPPGNKKPTRENIKGSLK